MNKQLIQKEINDLRDEHIKLKATVDVLLKLSQFIVNSNDIELIKNKKLADYIKKEIDNTEKKFNKIVNHIKELEELLS